jgi:glycine/D-amino acid oxidase-like deaminating enzyme
MDENISVIVVGGGLAGLLTAHRLAASLPANTKIALLEKESFLGGRLVTGGTSDQYGHGLQGISPRLYEFWNQALKSDPEANDLPALMNRRSTKAGVLAGSKVTEIPIEEIITEKGARALGGLAAARQWNEVTTLLTGEDRYTKAFADGWKSPRKSPATLVLETYAPSFGISDIWDSTPGAIFDRASCLSSRMHSGDWTKAIQALIEPLITKDRLVIHTNARVIDAEYSQQTGWVIDTAQGSFSAPRLIVAQPPWIASQWLPKGLWPASLAAIVSKTKPVSAVTLSCPIESGDTSSLPELIFIPAESCQAIIGEHEIVIQATIDYEMSLMAPDVVKAVKRLKRSLRKLLAAYPSLTAGVEHVALVPVGWAQSASVSERKLIDKLKMNAVQQPHLAFCGDAYGQSFDGDTNLVESVISSSEALTT